MSIDLGRTDITVAKKHLHDPQVRPAFKEMGGKGMAQDMGINALVYPGFQGINLDYLPEPLSRNGFSTSTEETVETLSSFQ